MQDEVLAKVLVTDVEAVPRYTIIDQNGNTIAQNATIILQNEVVQEGTPINTNTLLTPATAQAIGEAKGVAAPETVNEALNLLIAAGIKFYSINTNFALSWESVTNKPYKYIKTASFMSGGVPCDFGTMDTMLVAVSPAANSIDDWLKYGIVCVEHEGASLTFVANSIPTTDLLLDIIVAVLPMTEA